MGAPQLSDEELNWWTLQFTFGRSDADIAQQLGIKKEAAKSRAKAVIRRIKAKNRNHYVALMVGTGLVDFDAWSENFPGRKKDEPFYEIEITVLKLLIQGHRDAKITESLGCSRRTLEIIRSKLAEVRGVNNRMGCLIADYLFACQGK